MVTRRTTEGTWCGHSLGSTAANSLYNEDRITGSMNCNEPILAKPQKYLKTLLDYDRSNDKDNLEDVENRFMSCHGRAALDIMGVG